MAVSEPSILLHGQTSLSSSTIEKVQFVYFFFFFFFFFSQVSHILYFIIAEWLPTEIIAGYGILLALPPAVLEESPDVVKDDEWRRQGRPVEVLMDQAVAVEPPYLL